MKAIDLCFLIQKHAQKISKYYKKKGFWRTIIRSLVWVSYQKDEFLFFEIDLATFSSNLETAENWHFTTLTKEDIEQIPDYFDGWFTKHQALRRIDLGSILFSIRDNEKAVSFLWVEFNWVRIPALALVFCLPDTAAYLAYTYTRPENRMTGVAFWNQRSTLNYLKEHGYETVFLIVSPETKPPIRMVTKSGFRMFQVVCYKKFLLFLKYYRVKNPDTGQEKVFWRIMNTDKKIWRTFSSCYRI